MTEAMLAFFGGLALGTVIGLVLTVQLLAILMGKLAPGLIDGLLLRLDRELAEARKQDETFFASLNKRVDAVLGGKR